MPNVAASQELLANTQAWRRTHGRLTTARHADRSAAAPADATKSYARTPKYAPSPPHLLPCVGRRVARESADLRGGRHVSRTAASSAADPTESYAPGKSDLAIEALHISVPALVGTFSTGST